MGKFLGRLQFWRRASLPPLRLRVERERTAIGRCSDTLQNDLQDAVPAKALHDMLVALDELLTNVIMHAEQAAGPIEVEVQRSPGELELRIAYLADEFDPTAWRATHSGMTIAASRIGGLGIHLVRSLMDDFRYEYVDGRNLLTLIKRC
jgi:anti-sigma regulatory factor (Ser/Thr protein kinase)